MRLSDEDAEALGYRALVDGAILVDGGCTCEPEPDAPLCSDGCSVWRPTRTLCDDGKYLYSWLNTESTCTASCGEFTCVPTIPDSPTMPTTTMDDAEAEAYFGMSVATLLATDFIGGCGCTDPYTPPDCPPCACEDTAVHQFIIDTTPQQDFTLTWTTMEEGSCCYSGTSDAGFAYLCWLDGTWTLYINITLGAEFNIYATYQAQGAACDVPILTLVSSGGESFDWPATLAL
jgi:hypothetical protein